MRSFKTEGIIIKRINFGEADKIITVFSKEQGKISIKASGIRRVGSRRSPHVELLNNTFLTLHKTQALPILIEAQMAEAFSEIKEDLTKVGFAYHLCELVDGLCPENQENRQVFYLLKNTLSRLCQEQDQLVEIIHDFEVELLTLLGYWNTERPTQHINTQVLIESLLERKLKSRKIFAKVS